MQNASPMIVVDPLSGESINLTPLFSALHKFDSPANAPLSTGAREAIRRVMKVLNLTVHDQAVISAIDLANVYNDLHWLEEMFAELQVSHPATLLKPGFETKASD